MMHIRCDGIGANETPTLSLTVVKERHSIRRDSTQTCGLRNIRTPMVPSSFPKKMKFCICILLVIPGCDAARKLCATVRVHFCIMKQSRN